MTDPVTVGDQTGPVRIARAAPALIVLILAACSNPAPVTPRPTTSAPTAPSNPTTTGTIPGTQEPTPTGTRSPAIGLPDPFRTPGATNPDVTPATIGATICTRGWTATVRPPAAYTTELKRAQLASGYSIGSDRNLADYEEDHLVPLEVGGNPTAETNLWPEPRAGIYGAGTKDQLENVVNHMICDGRLSLADAQRMFMTDWIAAARRFGIV